MKIIQVCPRYYPYIGGVETHVKNISERLAKQYDISVFTTDPSGSLPEREEINGVNVIRFKSYAPDNAYYFSFEMLKKLRNIKCDIVHSHAYAAFPLAFSSLIQKKKFVVTPHYHRFGHSPIRNLLIKFYRPIGKKILKQADIIVCVSNYERNLLIDDFKLDVKNFFLIPNGINKNDFKNVKKEEKNQKKILYVGAINKFKGIEYIVDALSKLDDYIILEIIGKGPYQKKLVKKVNDLGLTKRVNFYGHLSRGELLKKYATADLFVLLSKYEAFGISVAEALASKTVCIVAESSALTEWVDNKNCYGIRYPMNIEKLSTLINNVIGKKIEGVNILDWNDVVYRLKNLYEFR